MFKSLVDAVCVRSYQLHHDPTRPLKQTVNLLLKFVEDELVEKNVANPSKFLRQWLQGEAICAFLTSKICYDWEIVDQTLEKGEELERYRSRMQAVEVVYGLQSPKATCSGSGRITERFAQLAGIKCWHIDGTTRQGHNGKAWEGTNHGWMVFEFDGGIRVPADTTAPWMERPPDYAKLTGKNGWRTMPVTKRQWEIFNGEYYNTQVDEGKPSPERLSLSTLSFEQWRAFNSTTYDFAKDHLDREASRQVGSRWNNVPLK